MEEFAKSHDEDIKVKTEICDESGFTLTDSFSKIEPFVLSDEKPYNCDQCDNIFESLIAFELHIEEHDEREVIHNFDTACNTIDPLALCSSVLRADSPDQNEEKPWKCDKCDKIFDRLSALELHANDHVEDVYPCTQCNSSLTVFKSENELQSHTEKNHVEVSSSRPVTSFIRSSNIPIYKTLRNGKFCYSCVWCKRFFFNIRLYKKHIGLLMTEFFSCCEMTFECEGLLEVHANTMHVTPNRELNNSMGTETSFTCSKCNQSFRCTESLQSHECSKSHSCEICNKSFQLEINLKKHKQTRHGITDSTAHTCKICNKSYMTTTSFQWHKRIQHGLIDLSYTCKICNESFQLESTLKGHMNTHTNENLYQCEVCNRSYALRKSFIAHKFAAHGLTDDTPHTCKICNKSFKGRTSLLSHERMKHLPHTCKICKGSYATMKSLLRHNRTQHGPHTCEICNIFYTARKSLLHKHKQHLRPSPHACEICNKSYESRKSVLWHKLTQHGLTSNTSHTCEICNKSNEARESFLLHKHKQHD